MKLFAIKARNAPGNELDFVLATSDQEALEWAVYYAAQEAVDAAGYGSLSAQVYCVNEDVRHVGQAWATDAPREWEWAHPGVAEAVARDTLLEIEINAEHDGGAM